MKKFPVIVTFLLPRLRDLIFIGVLYSMVLGGPKLFTNEGDLGWHTTIGKFILNTGTIPTSDIFSHTMYGARFVPHEWGAEVAFAVADRFMGLNGPVLLAALLAAVTILLVYEELIKRGVFRLVALFLTLWIAFVASVHWLARPHMFTFLFIAIWTYALERVYKSEAKKIWYFSLLMWIWANTHGAFFAGFVVWGTYFVDWLWEFWQGRGTKEMGKQLTLIGALSFAVTFINPSGWYLWETTVSFVSSSYLTSHIVEYFSPDFHNKEVWPFMFMVAFALFALMQERKIHVREALLLSGWTVMGLYSIRNLPLFAVTTAPIFGGLIQSWAEKLSGLAKSDSNLRETEKMLRGNFVIVAATLLFGYLLWSGVPLDEKGVGNIYLANKMPVQAVNWLQENPQIGKMFNNYLWGGYILYRMWPEQTTFIDARTDFFGEKLLREYLIVNNTNAGWEGLLDKYDVSWIFIPREGVFYNYLGSNKNTTWHLIYEDDFAVIYRR
jgi:hypothetical protein